MLKFIAAEYIRKKGCFSMKIGDDSFTRTMLINSLSQSEKSQSQMGTTTSGFSNLFAAVLNQLLIQQDLQPSGQPMPSSFAPNLVNGNQSMTPDLLSMVNGNQSMTSDLLSMVNGNQSMTPDLPNMVTGNISLNKDEPLHFQPVNSEKINHVLGGKLTGMGDAFVRAGQQFNVSPALLTAIAQHESGNGKSHAAVVKNNIAGMMGTNGLKSYPSVEDSINDMARNLSKNYIGTGLSNISKIGAKYAPIGAENDPTALNNNWVSGVTQYFDKLRV
jgi:hypothetical protein